jgi:hypothetical protein
MPRVLTLTENGYEVGVVVDQANATGAIDASIGDVVDDVSTVAKRTLSEAVGVLGQLACAFTRSLTAADPKPAEVQLEFGLEAAGEAGNFVVSKVSGKSNFSVKMLWKFDQAN